MTCWRIILTASWATEEVAGGVHIKGFLPEGERHLVHGACGGDTGVGDEDVETAVGHDGALKG